MDEIPQPGTKGWFLDASPWYKAMRASAPVFYDQRMGSWQVFLYTDVERVLTQFGTYSSQFGYNNNETTGRADQGAETDAAEASIMGSLLTTDPPFHTKLRNIVSRSFSPASIAALEPRIREIASPLLAGLDAAAAKGGRSTDFVTEFAEPLPVIVIAEMLGIPVEDRARFKRWSDIQIGSADIGPETQGRANRELAQYLGAIIAERKKDPRDDLISSIVTSEIDGERLSLQEAVSFCVLLLIAGNETTTNLLGNAIRLFARYGSMKQLHDKPSAIPGAIEEVLRFASPVRAMFRVSVKDSEVSGHEIPSGHSVLAWIASANRDERKFPDADKFDIGRTSNPHIAFGHGIHYCLGAPLARLESKVALQLLTERYSEVKLKVPDEHLVPVKNFVVGGVQHLPVEFAG
jgi:cytochrome P450